MCKKEEEGQKRRTSDEIRRGKKKKQGLPSNETGIVITVITPVITLKRWLLRKSYWVSDHWHYMIGRGRQRKEREELEYYDQMKLALWSQWSHRWLHWLRLSLISIKLHACHSVSCDRCHYDMWESRKRIEMLLICFFVFSSSSSCEISEAIAAAHVTDLI